MSCDRRHFLRQSATVGLACGASQLFGGFLSAQDSLPNTVEATRVYVDPRRTVAPLDRNLFGSFLEHLGRAIYGGIYDPGSTLSDESGFRKDVMAEVGLGEYQPIRHQ